MTSNYITPFSILVNVGDEIIREMNVLFLIKLLHFLFRKSALYSMRPFDLPCFSHSNENRMDTKVKMECFFWTLHKVLFCWNCSNKNHSHSTEQWLKCHCLLSLNLTWCDVSKMVASPATQWTLPPLKALRRFIFLSNGVLLECRYRWWPSRTSTGSHLHSRLLVGKTFCLENLSPDSRRLCWTDTSVGHSLVSLASRSAHQTFYQCMP